MYGNLFFNHQLNYDEAVRRLEHWSKAKDGYALGAIRTLAAVLRNNRNNLYFEDSDNGN